MRWPIWRAAVAERSMEPGLRPGDYLLLTRPARPGRTVRVRIGQVVAARHPLDADLLLIKRAMSLEPGGWWLEADNPRAGGIDSWRFGPVPPALIEGRLLCRYWPPRLGRRPQPKSDPGRDGHDSHPGPDPGT